jgi:Tol biopolymer transport system component
MKTVLTFILMGALAAGAALVAQTRAANDLFQEALAYEEVKGDLQKAIATYQTILTQFAADRPIAARALLHLGRSYERLGRPEAAATYDRLIRDYADQAPLVAEARTRRAGLASRAVAQSETALVERQQVWAGDEVDLQGRPSWDGRYLPYVAGSGGAEENLAVRDLVTGQSRVLAQARGSARGFPQHPSISPDGQFIAYAWYAYTPDGDRHSLNLVRVDGSGMRVITPLSGDVVGLAWAPDGTRIAAVLRMLGNTRQVVVISVSDGSVTQLLSAVASSPAIGNFSPDGRFLVFAAVPPAGPPDDSNLDIFSIAIDGSSVTPLVQGPARDAQPAWTPDGNAVAFISNRSGTNGLWAVRVRDGKPVSAPVEVRPDVGDTENMGFSRSGTLFYGVYATERDVYIAAVDPSALRVTGDPRRLTEHFAGLNSTPHWSPDGRTVAFLRGRFPREQSIVLRSMPDGIERTLPTKLVNAGFVMTHGMSWFPDGRSLLIRDDHPAEGGRTVVRRIDIDTGRDRVLFEAGRWDVWPPLRLSPDGTTVYYTAFARDATRNVNDLRLIKRDLTTGHETELLRRETGFFSFYGLLVSPDASRLAFLESIGAGPRTLVTLSASGGQPAELYPTGSAAPRPTSSVGAWMRTWTRDGKYVITKTGDGNVWAFPTGPGEPHRLDWPLPAVGELSPDGRHTVYPVFRQTRELRTIQNLLSRIPAAQ